MDPGFPEFRLYVQPHLIRVYPGLPEFIDYICTAAPHPCGPKPPAELRVYIKPRLICVDQGLPEFIDYVYSCASSVWTQTSRWIKSLHKAAPHPCGPRPSEVYRQPRLIRVDTGLPDFIDYMYSRASSVWTQAFRWIKSLYYRLYIKPRLIRVHACWHGTKRFAESRASSVYVDPSLPLTWQIVDYSYSRTSCVGTLALGYGESWRVHGKGRTERIRRERTESYINVHCWASTKELHGASVFHTFPFHITIYIALCPGFHPLQLCPQYWRR